MHILLRPVCSIQFFQCAPVANMNFRSCYNLKIQLFLAALVRFLHFGFKTVARSWMRIFPTDMFIMMCRLLSAAVKFAKALAMWIEDPDESAFWIQFICVKSAEILLKRIRFDSLVFAILPHVIWMVFFFFSALQLVTCLTSHSWATENLVPLSLPSFHWWNHTANNSRNTNFIYFSWLNFQSDPLHFIGNIFVSTLWLTQIQIGLINYNITTISILYCNWEKKMKTIPPAAKYSRFFSLSRKYCCVVFQFETMTLFLCRDLFDDAEPHALREQTVRQMSRPIQMIDSHGNGKE